MEISKTKRYLSKAYSSIYMDIPAFSSKDGILPHLQMEKQILTNFLLCLKSGNRIKSNRYTNLDSNIKITRSTAIRICSTTSTYLHSVTIIDSWRCYNSNHSYIQPKRPYMTSTMSKRSLIWTKYTIHKHTRTGTAYIHHFSSISEGVPVLCACHLTSSSKALGNPQQKTVAHLTSAFYLCQTANL